MGQIFQQVPTPGVPNMGMGAPAIKQPGFLEKLMGALGGNNPNMDPAQNKQLQQQALMAMASQLMAAGGESTHKVSFGEALGPALMAGQQARAQGEDQALKQMLMQSQIQKSQQKQRGKLVPAIDPATGQPVYKYEEEAEGMQPYAKPGAEGQTPSAIQEYEYWKSLKTPAEQDAYLTIKRNMQPYQWVESAGAKGGFNRATNTFTPQTTVEEEAAAAGQLAAGAKAGEVAGTTQATAQVDLPRVEANAEQALETVKQLKSHPGLPYITGLYSAAPILPGTPQAGADALAKQIQGKTFLEAFNTLKGGGQITEVEGAKAESAIARLSRAQHRREYVQALGELEEVMKAGVERARTKAGVQQKPRSREEILKQYGL
jgi:hypothetical protein